MYISSQGVDYNIPSLSARCSIGTTFYEFLRVCVVTAQLQVVCKTAMSDNESHKRAAISQDQFTLLMGAFSALQTRMEEKFAVFRAEVRWGQEDATA